jgi:hypothetical protein
MLSTQCVVLEKNTVNNFKLPLLNLSKEMCSKILLLSSSVKLDETWVFLCKLAWMKLQCYIWL